MKITSAANPRVKAAAKLRNARDRSAQSQIIIDGVREIGRAVDAHVKLCEVFVCEELCRSADYPSLLVRLRKLDVARFDVTPAIFAKIAFGQRAEGIVAVASTPQRSLDQLQFNDKRRCPLLVVLEGVEKPGNIGAVLRSADGAGVSAVIVANGGSDLYNPNAIRASLGTIFTLPVCSATTAETLAWLRKQRLAIFAARVDGSIDFTAADFTGPTAIILGSESSGLSDAWIGDDIRRIRLPMLGSADSLNVSAAAAVLFYEAHRQRSPA
jgi:TrmH family RNA methyltransferase